MNMLREKGIPCDDTNDADTFILKGCIYYTSSFKFI